MCSLYFRSLFFLSSALAESPRWTRRLPAAPTRPHFHLGSQALSTEGVSGRHHPEAEEEDKRTFKTLKLHTKCLTLGLVKKNTLESLQQATDSDISVNNIKNTKDTKYISLHNHNLTCQHNNITPQNKILPSNYLKHFCEGFLARFIEHFVCNRSGSRSICFGSRPLMFSLLVFDRLNKHAILWYLKPLAARVGYQNRLFPMEGLSIWSHLKLEHEPDG